jgi:hypothetical protein
MAIRRFSHGVSEGTVRSAGKFSPVHEVDSFQVKFPVHFEITHNAFINNNTLVTKNTDLIPIYSATCPPRTDPPNTPKYPADMLRPKI